MSQTSQWSSKLSLCTSSIEDFYSEAPKILSLLKRNEHNFSDFFYKTIPQLIINKQFSPRSRFYSLYLLLKATEKGDLATKGDLLQDHTLISFLYRAAAQDSNRRIPFEERGKKFFSIGPTLVEAMIGINFVRLSLECLISWKLNYTAKSQNSTSDALSFYMGILQKEVRLPKSYQFIDKNYCLSQDLAMWDYIKKAPIISDEILEDRIDSQRTIREVARDARQAAKQSEAKIKPELEIEVVETKASEHSLSYQMSSSMMKNLPISPDASILICRSPKNPMFRPKNYNELLARDLEKVNRSIERSRENAVCWRSSSKEIETPKKGIDRLKSVLGSPRAEKESIQTKLRISQSYLHMIQKPNSLNQNNGEEGLGSLGKRPERKFRDLFIGYQVNVK